RQLGAALRVEVRHRHLLVGWDVEPRTGAVEDEELLLRPRVAPAHLRQRTEDDSAALALAVLESLGGELLGEARFAAGKVRGSAVDLGRVRRHGQREGQ